MKKITLLLLATLIAFANLNAQDLSLDEILNNYYEVMGLKNYDDINSIIMNGKSVNSGMETPFTITTVKPDKFRLEVDIQGQKMVQAYNSGSAWYIAPWTGTLEPQDLPPEQIKSMKRQADMEGPLYKYQEKGNTVELLGKEDMEGSEVYLVKLTFPDGDSQTYYIDAENFVILKEKSITTMRGQEITAETFYSDFKPEGDLMMAHSFEVKMNGQTGQAVVIETVKFNESVDETIFDKPVKKEAEAEKE
ncbi:MAG: hypothetical protein C0598_03975 [Marinilabiliales bacterium]|nr:MAG: hypothetical protein C0598_03975 [Marinilabiliales bacterium]